MKMDDRVETQHGIGRVVAVDLKECSKHLYRFGVKIEKYHPGIDGKFWNEFLNNVLYYPRKELKLLKE